MNKEIPEGCIGFFTVAGAAVAMLMDVDLKRGRDYPQYFTREQAMEQYGKYLDEVGAYSDDQSNDMYKLIKAALEAIGSVRLY